MFKENQERTPCFLSNADFWRCCLRPRPPSAKALHQPRLASTKDSFAHGPLAKTQFSQGSLRPRPPLANKGPLLARLPLAKVPYDLGPLWPIKAPICYGPLRPRPPSAKAPFALSPLCPKPPLP